MENIFAILLGLFLGSLILWGIRRFKKEIARDLEEWEREIKDREEMWELVRKLEKMGKMRPHMKV